MPVTIRDIARFSRVSTATVSRVINNSPNVTEQTRKAVQRALRELDYRPPVIARALTRQSLKTIGLMIPEIANLYYPVVIKAIEDELSKLNFNILLCISEESVAKERRYIDNLLTKGVDGMIFLGTRPALTRDEHIVRLSDKIPVLLVNDYILGSNVHSVMADEVEGSYKATCYLIGLGHRRIGFVTGNVDFTTYKYKRTGFERAMADNRIEVEERFVVEEDPHERGGYRAGIRLLDLPERPTALFTVSDQVAIGIMQAYYERGLSIPTDLSLVGFGDMPIAAALHPPLTTVNQFPERTGQIAAQTIIKMIRNEELEQKRIILDPQLTIRRSCAPIGETGKGE